MILKYYEGANFGDAINPIIFKQLLPDFFDDDESTIFLGIGSVLGFIKGDENTRKIIVFSSGFAYDDAPKIDSRYDIRCVRGPLTASSLNIDPNLAITDGAALIRSLPEFMKPLDKKYKFSFIPHHVSDKMFDRWVPLFNEMGVNYISPRGNPVDVIKQIRQSECILAEAMHGAIISDSLRIPWIPVKMFEHINDFKWKDWLLSLEMDYNPVRIFRLYNNEWIRWIINDKLKIKEESILNRTASLIYRNYQNIHLEKKFKSELTQIMSYTEPALSKDSILIQKESRLLEELDKVKHDYLDRL